MYTSVQFGIGAAGFFDLAVAFDGFIKASEVIYKLVEEKEADDKVIVAKLLKEVVGFTPLNETDLAYFVDKGVYHAKKFYSIEK